MSYYINQSVMDKILSEAPPIVMLERSWDD